MDYYRDPDTIARQEAVSKKKRMDKDDEERMADFIAKQVERNNANDEEDKKYTELQRESEEEKLSLTLNTTAVAKSKPEVVANPSVFKIPSRNWSSSGSVKSFSSTTSSKGGKRKSALEELREEQERFKEKKFHKDYWLVEAWIAISH